MIVRFVRSSGYNLVSAVGREIGSRSDPLKVLVFGLMTVFEKLVSLFSRPAKLILFLALDLTQMSALPFQFLCSVVNIPSELPNTPIVSAWMRCSLLKIGFWSWSSLKNEIEVSFSETLLMTWRLAYPRLPITSNELTFIFIFLPNALLNSAKSLSVSRKIQGAQPARFCEIPVLMESQSRYSRTFWIFSFVTSHVGDSHFSKIIDKHWSDAFLQSVN